MVVTINTRNYYKLSIKNAETLKWLVAHGKMELGFDYIFLLIKLDCVSVKNTVYNNHYFLFHFFANHNYY